MQVATQNVIPVYQEEIIGLWLLLRSDNTTDWTSTLCTKEEATSQDISTEVESSFGVHLQDSLNEEQVISSLELETSLDDPPLQSEAQVNPPVLPSFQVFEGGTKRGQNKLIDDLGYTYNIKLGRPNVTYWQCTVWPKDNPCKAAVTQSNKTFVKKKYT